MGEKMIPRRIIAYGADESEVGGWSVKPLALAGFHYVPEDLYAETVRQRDMLYSALNEVVTNGEDTEGEQRGDWIISREVCDDAKEAVDAVAAAGEWNEMPA